MTKTKKRTVRKDKALLIEVGRRLRELRLEQNITNEKIDETLKISIYRYEKALVNVSLSNLALICKYYKISLSELLNGMESSFEIEE
ncbi:MAG: helix-turn-helix domain-containing protein [Alistipes sp.]|nr:helix-turn-helix domain-containing protein [Alistipes sp.]